MSPVATEDTSSAATQDTSSVATQDMEDISSFANARDVGAGSVSNGFGSKYRAKATY